MKHDNVSHSTVSRETAQRLQTFSDLVRHWNRTINLVARGDEAHLDERHIQDALNLLPYLPPSFDRAIDLGSGAGFPGLVLAIATDRHFDLVESDQRKAAFLREAARVTGTRVTVHAVRAEAASIAHAPLITARALAPLPVLLTWAAPLLSPNGVCIFPKGRNVQQELTAAGRQWQMRVEQWASPLDSTARILRLSEISRV